MDLKEEQLTNTQDDVRQQHDDKPNAYRVSDAGNTNEASLKRNYIIGGEMKNANAPGMEGEGMGGHQFGRENYPPTGDDPANPSRNAGYTNAYLALTEPLEEHPENNNFKSLEQQGEPNYQTIGSAALQQYSEQGHQNTQVNTHEPHQPDYNE